MRVLACLAAAAMTSALCACQTNSGGGAIAAFSNVVGTRTETPIGPVAFESIAGAPEPVRQELGTALVAAAAARHVRLVSGADAARYRVRGYLSAFRGADGKITLAYVWDVFDAGNKRSRRVAGQSAATATSGGDPWAAATPSTIRNLANSSMDGIASSLAASAERPRPE